MNENWRDVPGYEGKYQISIDTPEGRCRSLSSYGHFGKTGELTQHPNKMNRLYWAFYNEGKRTTKQAAFWIAITYPEQVQNEYFEGAEIDHIDTNPMNNHPSNLRWTTRKENMNNPFTVQHLKETAWKGGWHHKEETKEKKRILLLNRQDQSKKVKKLSTDDNLIAIYPSLSEASRENKIAISNIVAVCKGNKKTAGGYIWRYAE